jgi:hypothetical protein
MGKGGVIGKSNEPAVNVASGIWYLQEQFNAKATGGTGWPVDYSAFEANSVVGLAGKFVSGTSWRSNIATGNVSSLPLTDTNVSSTVTGTTGLPTANHRFGLKTWTTISYSTLGDNYGFIAIGYFKPPTTGTYTFYTTSDDGSGVWVGSSALGETGRTTSTAVVNNGLGSGQGSTKRSGTIDLVGGLYYAIRVVHEEGAGGDNLTFAWSGPGIAETSNLNVYFRTASTGGVLTGDYTISSA